MSSLPVKSRVSPAAIVRGVCVRGVCVGSGLSLYFDDFLGSAVWLSTLD